MKKFEIKGGSIQLPISPYKWHTIYLKNNGAKFSGGKYDRMKLKTPEPCRSFNIVALQNQKSRSMVLKLCFSDPEISIRYVKVLLKASIFTMGNLHADALHYIKVKSNHTYIHEWSFKKWKTRRYQSVKISNNLYFIILNMSVHKWWW